jgi:CHAT domain-containing protein
MHLPARLAVLSSCESAGGRVLSGEGVQGLTSAFLSAGVPTVLATLWRIDDRSTVRLITRFYEELASGQTAAGALGAAQESMREDPSTRWPYYWAGFVLVGDGETSVNLQRRGASTGYLPLLLLPLAVVSILLIRRWVRR